MVETLFNEELLDVDLLFPQLWEASIDGMRIIDEKGIILLVNDSFCKMFRMNRDDLIGKPFSIVYQESERKEALTVFQKDIANNEIKTFFERENTLWDGRKIWLEFSNAFINTPRGQKITLSIIKDISQRKHSELELRESEYKFKMLFNAANDGIFVTQMTPGKAFGDFIEVNDIACTRLGYTKEEFLKLSPSAIVHPSDIDKFNLSVERLLQQGHIIYEVSLRAKDKKIIPSEISSHLFFYQDKLTVLSVARDISERKQSEEKLKRTSKLLRELASHLQSVREEERTIIAREIHDELGQMLTVLKIKLSLLSNKIEPKHTPLTNQFSELLKLIDTSIETVQKISTKLRPNILDELGLFTAIEWQVNEFEKMTNIKCSLVLPSADFKVDSEQSTVLFRILQEALTNIARHSGAKKVSITLSYNPSKIILEIKDDGKGITDEKIKDVKSLGIHGMEERVKVFGGSFQIEGFAGLGTSIKVELPIIDGKNEK